MNLLCIIQARLNSSRLPNKVFADLNGKPILEHVVNRVKAVNILDPLIDHVVVATTDSEKDDLLARWCLKKEIDFFRGSEEDVLSRYYECAKQFNAKNILRITSDCPLLDPFLIYGLLMKKPWHDYQALAFNRREIVPGQDCELFSFRTLEYAHFNSKQREHVSTFMRRVGEDQNDYGTDFDYGEIKYDLDTVADLERIRKLEKYC